MRKNTSRPCAGALLAVLAATFLAPLAALARGPARSTGPHGCHCPVKMACCEAGLCHGGAEGSSPASSPSWSGCRDESPAEASVPTPFTAFDSALLPGSFHGVHAATSTASAESPTATDAVGPAPAIPPPRASIADC